MITGLPRVAVAVRDMDCAIRRFRDRFAMPVHEFAWAPDELGARMALCAPAGGSHIELVAPSDPSRAHSRTFLQFLERRGEGLFALMLNARDPDAEVEALAWRGLAAMPRMEEAGGRDIHPRNACGVLIRIYPTDSRSRVEPELESVLGPVSARRSGAGLSGIRRVLVAVRDLDTALAVYRDRLGLYTIVAGEDAEMDARRAICTPSEGAQIELLAPVANGGPIDRFVREHGQGMYALVLESEDPEASVRTLRANGIALRLNGGEGAAWETDRDAACGVRFRVERRGGIPRGGEAWT